MFDAVAVLTMPISVTIKTVKGEKFVVEIDDNANVADLKESIAEAKSEFSVESQKLIFAGKILQDGAAINEIGLKPDSFIAAMVSSAKPKAETSAVAPAVAAAPTPMQAYTGCRKGSNDVACGAESSLKAADENMMDSISLKRAKIGDCLQDDLSMCGEEPLTSSTQFPVGAVPVSNALKVPSFSESARRCGRLRPMPPPIICEKLCDNTQWRK